MALLYLQIHHLPHVHHGITSLGISAVISGPATTAWAAGNFLGH
jgi:hypothetical protein